MNTWNVICSTQSDIYVAKPQKSGGKSAEIARQRNPFQSKTKESPTTRTRKQLQSLSGKISVSLQPVFSSGKIGNIIKPRESTFKNQDKPHCSLTTSGLDYVMWSICRLITSIDTSATQNTAAFVILQWRSTCTNDQHKLKKPDLSQNFSVTSNIPK